MTPIAVFYHALFYFGSPPELRVPACAIVAEQMGQLQESGLAAAANEIVIGINGPPMESAFMADTLLPARARKIFHGPDSFSENLTIVEVENWVKTHPHWFILYFHAKGCTHPEGSPYAASVSEPWRRIMMAHLVMNWQACVRDLEAGYDIACVRWMWNMADGTQHIPAGNFLWVKSNFVASLPSIYLRDRIKLSGIAAKESRYEAEVYWGNGRTPYVRTYQSGPGNGIP